LRTMLPEANDGELKAMASVNLLLRLIEALVDDSELSRARRTQYNSNNNNNDDEYGGDNWLEFEDDSLLGIFWLVLVATLKTLLLVLKIVVVLSALIFFGPRVSENVCLLLFC
jgi:hypothetical protein